MSTGVPLDITVRSTQGRSLVGIDLYILEVGDPDRFPDLTGMDQAERDAAVAAFLATETQVQVYEDRALTVEVEQPLLTGVEGRTPYYIGADSVDRYAPQAGVNPIKPQEVAPGWPFRDNGLRALTRSDFDPPNAGDLSIGDGIRGVEPGAEGRLAMRWALRVGSWYMNSKTLRSRAQSMWAVLEQDDPAELWLQRTPGVNKMVPTGSGEYDRKHPPGKSTVVAADALAGAGTLYIVDAGYGIPSAWDPADVTEADVASVEYLVDDQSIAWTSKTSLVATLSGDAALGDTELLIAEPTAVFPDVGKAFMQRGGVLPQWTGRSLVLDANADGLHKAGVTTLLVKNVTQAEADALPAEGTLRVAAGTTGTDIRRWAYESFTYDSGTEKVTFTFAATKVNRNIIDNAAVTMAKLTGIKSEFQMPTLGDKEAGATTLVLNFDHDHGDPPVAPTEELIDKIPPLGFVRFEVRDDDPDGPGLVDFPVRRRAYTDWDEATRTITVPAGLPEDVPDDSWVWIEGCEGMMRAHNNGTQLRVGRLNGVTGLTNAVSQNDIAEWSPRYRNPGTPGSLGFLAGVLGGVGGLVNKNTQIAMRAIEDAIKQSQRGGEIDVMIVVPDQGYRKPVAAWTSAGLALLGGGLTGSSGTAHRLHVADWGCRTKPPGLVCECDPDDPDCNPDDIVCSGDEGQLGSATLGVDHVEGALSVARVVLSGYNRETGNFETLELDYTGTDVDEDGNATLTGVTLASVTGYVLGDYFFDAGSLVRYADSVISSAVGVETNATFSRGKESEVQVGNAIVESDVPRPGLLLGSAEEPLFARGDGKARFGTSGAALATETYADLLAQGVKWKETVQAATTADITLANQQTIDGVSVVAGDRVLVKNQTNQTENGIWICAAGTNWARATDANSGPELEAAVVAVAGGTVNGNTTWRQTTDSVTLGVSNIVWTEMAGLTTAGAGLTRSGNTVDAVAGTGITVAADSISADPSGFNLSGTHAARPAAGTAGRTYFETDTGVLYRDTGAAWLAQGPGTIRKTANQTFTQSSTTLQNVTELLLPVEAGENWSVEVFLFVVASGAADWKFGFTGPVGASLFWGVFGSSLVTPGNWNAVDAATAPGSIRGITQTVAVGSTNNTHAVHLAGMLRNPTNAGTLQLQAAQNTATAVDNIIAADSWMRVTRLV